MVEELNPNNEPVEPGLDVDDETETTSPNPEEDLFVKKRLNHDEFFRCAFVDKSLVESFLRENFSKELVKELDFSTLEQSRESRGIK